MARQRVRPQAHRPAPGDVELIDSAVLDRAVLNHTVLNRTDQVTAEAVSLAVGAAQDALERGEFQRVQDVLAGVNTAAAWHIRGAARRRSGHILDSETPIRTALALGSSEARVEYGQWLLACGKVAEALWYLAEVGAALPPGEERTAAQLAQAQAMFALELPQAALALTQATYDEAVRRQAAPPHLARIAQVLAQQSLFVGQPRRAYMLARQAVATLADELDPAVHFRAWHTLARAQQRLGQPENARLSLELARQSLTPAAHAAAKEGTQASPLLLALRLLARIESHHLAGELEAARAALSELGRSPEAMSDYALRQWTGLKLSEVLSEQGQHARAVDVLSALGTTAGLPPRLRVLRGVLMRRQRHYLLALEDLAAAGPLRESDPLLYWRGQLHRADTLLHLGQFARASAILERSLRHLLETEDCAVYAPDINELAELVMRALLDPERAALMQAVLARLGGEAPGQLSGDQMPGHQLPGSASALPLLEVYTLGKSMVKRDGQTVAGLSAGAVLMLSYLALHPQQSRNAMQAVLFPDFNRQQTAAFFRGAVRELRSALGPGILELDDTLRHPRYRVSGEVRVSLDLSALRTALSLGDLPQAARQYLGAFMPAFEAPDTWDESGWNPDGTEHDRQQEEPDTAPGHDPPDTDLLEHDSESGASESDWIESDWANAVRSELRLSFNLALAAALAAARPGSELRRILGLTEGLLELDPAIEEMAPELQNALEAAQARSER